MKLTSYKDHKERICHWHLVIDESEFYSAMIDLDNMDKALVKECDESHSIADKLLALEVIFRRMEQSKLAMKKEDKPFDEEEK